MPGGQPHAPCDRERKLVGLAEGGGRRARILERADRTDDFDQRPQVLVGTRILQRCLGRGGGEVGGREALPAFFADPLDHLTHADDHGGGFG